MPSLPISFAALESVSSAHVGAEDRHERGAVAELVEVGWALGTHEHDALGQAEAGALAIHDVADHAEHHPRDADVFRLGVKRDNRDPGEEGADAADHGRDRDLAAANADVARHPVGPFAVGVFDPQRDDRGVRGRERQHRAERVEVAQHVDVGEGDQQHGEGGEEDDREPGRAIGRVQPREDPGQLAMLRQRPRQARDADQPGVGGDEENRRGEQPDVVLRGIQQHPPEQAEVVDDRRAPARTRRTAPAWFA